MAVVNPVKFREYMRILGLLKQVKRAGWLRKEIDNPESVADHMYRMAMMAFAIPQDSGLDRDKCIKIALVHDMAESIVGDITPHENVDKAVKSRKENEATLYITNLIGGESGKEMYNLWLEYENQTSPEAKFVKEVDKLEMIYQATEYEEQTGRLGELQEFFNYTNEKLPKLNDFTQSWKDELETYRNENIAKNLCDKGDGSTSHDSSVQTKDIPESHVNTKDISHSSVRTKGIPNAYGSAGEKPRDS